MFKLTAEKVGSYLETVEGGPVEVRSLVPLGGEPSQRELKAFGYGIPVRVDYSREGQAETAVIETLSENVYGHQHMADRAQVLLWSYHAFNHLPRHVAALDVGVFRSDGRMDSLASAQEFFILTEFAEGREYFRDLERIRDEDQISDRDRRRVDALCDYLVTIHSRRRRRPDLYFRHLRELLGHGECVMGIADDYPLGQAGISPQRLEAIEQKCLGWRWKLKNYSHRLSEIHGDFHPWNILFREGADFTALDRARGEWGEPANDLTSITMNYVFFSLQRHAKLAGGLEELFHRFWNRYLEQTEDREILEVTAPFFAFRGLVMASPVWYPDLAEEVREGILRFVEAVLARPVFELDSVNLYCRL